MSRIVMSIEEINHLIREEMRKHEKCARVSLKTIYWHEPDASGCNWDANMFEGDATDPLECRKQIIDTVRDLRARYNIPNPG
ncbi:MAG TPA: hypothetical protein VJ698_10820 [Noviherbaspirillum sp.]|uniref:hypothetical protein n=1 Tax=Noviherbaspirillum sp. TaxID=1926288 RepID=UPI002B47DE09|nr:hypothetical protein [Noviherbaspirillum sp.]HJV85958.1 hypothetical protein [Noviherbaspirillum sp.]